MKKTLAYVVLLYVVLVSCSHAPQTQPSSPSTITVNVYVYDNNTSNPINAAQVTLNYNNSIGAIPITQATYYTQQNGKISFQFSPQKGNTYFLGVDKQGYSAVNKPIDKNIQTQNFNVGL